MKTAIITINKDGKALAEKLKIDFPDADIFVKPMTSSGSLRKLVGNIFNKYEGLIFIAALGITVRLIGGFVKNKFQDPAVVSIDTAGRFSISVLSGHEGGANKLAFLAAASLGAVPVVTTGLEAHKRFILGIGTTKGIRTDKVKKAIRQALKSRGIKPEEIRLAATIELKKNEKGLIKACDDFMLPLVFISREAVANFKADSVSEIVRRRIGLDGVCEPCAVLAGRRAKLILKKQTKDGVAVAIAEEN